MLELRTSVLLAICFDIMICVNGIAERLQLVGHISPNDIGLKVMLSSALYFIMKIDEAYQAVVNR